MSEGQALRDAGASQVSDNAPSWWKQACDTAIAQHAARRQPFTAEDIRIVVGDPPNHPNAMGARFLAAAKGGLIERVGYQKPVRASRHANPLSVWRGVK
jgi:hypothetical protein